VRHMAMVCDTPRHAGLGLHNRMLQVRFLSHLHEKAEFMGIAALWHQHEVCALAPM
jgi:hypothetical protein